MAKQLAGPADGVPEHNGGWHPSAEQELLLRAALWRGADARAAWETWRARVDLPKLDSGSFRLLPLLYLNLRSIGVESSALTQLRKVYDYFRFPNQILLFHGKKSLQTLHAAGIPTLLLKASALIPLYYHDVGARPMGDLDVLVPTSQTREALWVLHEMGWKTKLRPLNELPDAYLDQTYAHTLTLERVTLDLHQHVLFRDSRLHADDDFWTGAIPLDFWGIATLALNPADQLLHVCAHGTLWNDMPPVRWVADAYYILTHATVDWERLTVQAQVRELVLPLLNTLRYLHDQMNAPVPVSVLDGLARLPVTRAARLKFQLETQPPSKHNIAVKLWYHYDRFRTVSIHYQNENPLLRFPAYLRDIWNLHETRQVPGYIANFARQRLTGGSS
ncbi:MAG TPA: nucleotidyltransferase family protein [Anaerolineae bacterium]|nr:nucleotidyltransferase family protein [Anaerolineae bacterium]